MSILHTPMYLAIGLCFMLNLALADYSLKLLACSDLASLYYGEITDKLETISKIYDLDLVELSNFVAASAYQKCVDVISTKQAHDVLEGEEFHFSGLYRQLIEFDLEEVSNADVNLELSARQVQLMEDFEIEVERLQHELEKQGVHSNEDGNNPPSREAAEERINGITSIIGAILIVIIAVIGALCYCIGVFESKTKKLEKKKDR